jgi:O-antigen ligase
MFWGLTVFMPVGVPYLAALLLLAALLAAGGWRERAQRLRSNTVWWPVAAYVVWTLVVLALEPQYPQTASNLVHGLRIAATVLMALALTREEAIWALRGFLLMALFNIVLIAMFWVAVALKMYFPILEVWRGVIFLIGNKSISNALLFTILGATAAVFGLQALSEHRPLRALPAFAVTLAVIVIITFSLPSRTSLLALLLVIPAACVHQWRGRLKVLALVLMAGGAIVAVGLWNSPAVQQKFELGVQELEQAQAGAVSAQALGRLQHAAQRLLVDGLSGRYSGRADAVGDHADGRLGGLAARRSLRPLRLRRAADRADRDERELGAARCADRA